MIVRETSEEGERCFELNREHLNRIKALTGLDETAVYTKLNTGKPLKDGNYEWSMVRQ
jgi:hypothetical protein